MRTITAVSRLTGLGPHTLRAWEKRYGAVSPRRDGNGRRLYSPEDVSRLRKLASAVSRGYAIGKVALLPDVELDKLIAEEAPRAALNQAGELAERMLAAVADDRLSLCDEVLDLAVVCLSPADFLERFISPVMYATGEKWARGKFTAAQEHAVSLRVQATLHRQYRRLKRVARGPALVFGTLSGERHEFGAFGAAWLGSVHGLRSVYLGPDLPPEEIAGAASRIGAELVGLSIVNPGEYDYLGQLRALRARLPARVGIWLGGGGIDSVARPLLPADCRVIRSLDEFERRLEQLHPKRSGV